MLIKFNFNTHMVPELNKYRTTFPISEAYTTHRCNAAVRELRTEAAMAEVICNMLGIIKTYAHLSVIATKNDGRKACIVEYQKRPSENIQLCMVTENNVTPDTFSVVVCEMLNKTAVVPYSNNHKGTSAVIGLFPFLTEEKEAQKLTLDLKFASDDDTFAKKLCSLCNNFYYRLQYPTKVSAPVNVIEGEIAQSDIEKINEMLKDEYDLLTPDTPLIFELPQSSPVISSTPESNEKEEKKKKTRKRQKKIRNKYRYDDTWVLSEDEENRVPEFGDWYVLPPIADELAQKIALSRDFRKPLNTILLYGPSGTGKTELCKAIAAELGMPYYSICPGPDADKTDLTDSFVPQTEEEKELELESLISHLGIPSFDDVENDFKDSFKTLFGKVPSKADSPADCYTEITKRILEVKSTKDRDFVHVETELVKAFRSGGLLEIQEPDVIKRASVLTFLNPILNGDGKNDFIQLATGEILRRNKNCIVIFTSNRNYDGCNELQQSIYSRISLIREIKMPNREDLISRTKADTNFPDDAILSLMAETVEDIHGFCVAKDISDGICGPRELYNWAVDAMLIAKASNRQNVGTEDVIKAAIETVLSSATQNEDDYEEIVNGVFLKSFSPSVYEKVRKSIS